MQDEVLVEELHRLSSENKRLNETLTNMCENYDTMQKQLNQLMNQNFENQTQQSRKRKAESESCINMFGSVRGININNNNNNDNNNNNNEINIYKRNIFQNLYNKNLNLIIE